MEQGGQLKSRLPPVLTAGFYTEQNLLCQNNYNVFEIKEK